MSAVITIDRITKIRLFTIATGLGLLLPVAAAHADQCQLIPKQQALAAMNRLEPGQTIYSLCELCGESLPQKIVIKTIELKHDPDSKLWEIKINDRGIDLAYTYVKAIDLNIDRDKPERNRSTSSQINLSIVAKCPAKGFTPIISIKKS
jgi:hypothetical protein